MIALFTSSSSSIVNVFLDRGSIPEKSLLEISELMILYIWSTLAVFNYIIFGLVLLSIGSVKKYAFWGIIAQLMSIIIILIFIKKIGIYIFPISLFISHLFSGIIMFSQFPYKSKLLYKTILKYLCVLFITSFVLFCSNKMFLNISNPIYNIAINSSIILFLLLILIFIFKLEEKKYINMFVQKIIQLCKVF